MNMFTRFFRKVKNRLLPKQTYKVEVLLYNQATDRYFAGTVLTTNAQTKAEARNNIRQHVRLHIGKCYAIKEKVNGSK